MLADKPPDTSPTPPPLVGMPPGPPWVIIIGAMFGAITLLGFFAFAFLAGTGYQGFICNSFELLAAVFALGVGLSGAFLGGGAAAQGHGHWQKFSIAYGVGGGVAMVVIMFAVFSYFKPACTAPPEKKSIIDFFELPMEVKLYAGKRYWHKDDVIGDNAKTLTRALYIRAENEDSSGRVEVMKDDRSLCYIDIHMVTDSTKIPHIDNYEIGTADLRDEMHFYFNSQWWYRVKRNLNTPKVVDHDCFQRLNGFLAVDLNHGKLHYGRSTKGPPDSRSGEDVHNVKQKAAGLMSTAAYAQTNVDSERNISFPELTVLLSSVDPETRSYAGAILGQEFDQYQNDVIKELFNPAQNPPYVAELLRGLIWGIDRATKETKLAVARADRDLDSPLPYVQEKLSAIIALSGHPDQEVRREARRLIELFPVSGFGAVFDRIGQEAKDKGCGAVKGSPSLESQLYSSIFYYYNRIVQYSSKISLTASEVSKIDDIAKTGYSLAECLSDNLRIDALSLTYGKFVTLAKFDEYQDLAKKNAAEFINFIDNAGIPDYYSPSHVEAAKRFLRGETQALHGVTKLSYEEAATETDSTSWLETLGFVGGGLIVVIFAVVAGVDRKAAGILNIVGLTEFLARTDETKE